jgi:predicted neuraminidase
MTMLRNLILSLVSVILVETAAQDRAQPGILRSQFVADPPPTASSHASTIVESKDSLICAWFGGTKERARDVVIWMARNDGKGWGRPEQLITGIHDEERVQNPLWNPVLFRPANGPLYLFYKEGPSPSEWWGLVMSSEDNGRTWTHPKKLPSGIFGPIRNKPIELADGTILCGSSTEDHGWRVHMERTKKPLADQAWTRTSALNRSIDFGAIQPTILDWAESGLQILCRSKQGNILESWSVDKGLTWSRMRETQLPNPNSAIDAVMLRDNRALLIYNHTTEGRGTLNVAISPDGRKWMAAGVLENTPGSEFSYPAVIQSSDRLVHVTYTWNRKQIKHVVLDPEKLVTRDILDGLWP